MGASVDILLSSTLESLLIVSGGRGFVILVLWAEGKGKGKVIFSVGDGRWALVFLARITCFLLSKFIKNLIRNGLPKHNSVLR